MPFPLYRRPGGVVFLDDDPDYIDMLAEVMPPAWFVRLLLRPVACIDLLQSETQQWEADAWTQQDIVNQWRDGNPLIPQILRWWKADATTRFGFTQVCVVDYSMPAMSGLQVLNALTDWPGSRILLTGRADEQLAVSAFNRGLIDRFIPKQSPTLRQQLSDTVTALLAKPNGRHQQTWRATLSREQVALLANAAVSQRLEALASQHGWVEHVVIGAPFGVLALNGQGSVSWLQLEPADRLKELAEMAESQGFDAATTKAIALGQQLVDLELQLALAGSHQARANTAFSIGAGSYRLVAALFELGEAFSPGPTSSYDAFSARHASRARED